MSAPGNTRPRGLGGLSPGGVAELTIQNDVVGELGLDRLEQKYNGAPMKTLEYIADHGGEVGWSWENIKQRTREMVADLIEAGLVVEREYVTHALEISGRLALRLTDKGRNVIEIHRKRKIVASAVQPLEAGELGD